MVKKVVAALVLAGSLVMCSAGVAGAKGTAPRGGCTNAAATLARLQGEEAEIAARLAALQAAAAQALGTNRTHHAHEIQERMAELSRAESRLAAQVNSLQARCPGTGTGGGPVIVA
jgi:hypothetical protein